MHIIAAKAVALKEAMEPEFKIYQKQVIANAKQLTKLLQQHNFDIVSNGTDNHLFLVNLIRNKLTGKEADKALELANITVNKNAVPNDPCSPFVTSGIRIGTSSITTRGFKTPEIEKLGHWIVDILKNLQNKTLISQIKSEVITLCRKFPVYEAN